MTNTKKPLKILQKKARPSGWSTSDTDEIERRRLRGVNEAIQIEPETRDAGFFGCFRAGSGDGQRYHVEIRSLSEPINSCDCPDHRINGLGTCKHIEATLLRLQYRRKRAFHQATAAGSPFIEVFLDRRDHRVRIRWPEGKQRRSQARDLLVPFFAAERRATAAGPEDTFFDFTYGKRDIVVVRSWLLTAGDSTADAASDLLTLPERVDRSDARVGMGSAEGMQVLVGGWRSEVVDRLLALEDEGVVTGHRVVPGLFAFLVDPRRLREGDAGHE